MARRFLLFLLMLFLLQASFRIYRRYFSPILTITFFDVGQGDAALIEFPYGGTMLVDAGGGFGEFNLGKIELFPELARKGILTLDVAMLSHPDQDHGFGFKTLFSDLRVKEFWYNAAFEVEKKPKPLFVALREKAQSQNVRSVGFSKSVDIVFRGGAQVRVIPLGISSRKTNDRSLVAVVSFAGCTALFTGDIEEGAERELLREFASPVTFLKVAHHGSKTSSQDFFLQAMRPRFGILSTGIRNRYGHPNPQALARLRARGLQQLRTDFHGFVSFRITPDGNFDCQSALGPCGTGACL